MISFKLQNNMQQKETNLLTICFTRLLIIIFDLSKDNVHA